MAQYAKKALTSYTTHNTAGITSWWQKYFQCLKDLIDAAKFSIHLQVYILMMTSPVNILAMRDGCGQREV